MSDSGIFLLILLFVFIGGDSFDATQLLLVLALFSTLCHPRFSCRGNTTGTGTTTTTAAL